MKILFISLDAIKPADSEHMLGLVEHGFEITDSRKMQRLS